MTLLCTVQNQFHGTPSFSLVCKPFIQACLFYQFVPSTGRKEADSAERTDDGCEMLLRKAALQLQTQILYSWRICGLVNLEVKCSLKWRESIKGSMQHCLVRYGGTSTESPEDLCSTGPQILLASHHILMLLYCQLCTENSLMMEPKQ